APVRRYGWYRQEILVSVFGDARVDYPVERGPVPIPKPFGDDEGKPPANGVVSGEAEDALGARGPITDGTLGVDDHERVGRTVDNLPQQGPVERVIVSRRGSHGRILQKLGPLQKAQRHKAFCSKAA